MDTHFRNFVIQTSTIFFSECYPSEVILLWTYIASSGQVSGKWGTFGDSLKFNGNDLIKVYLSFVVERGREPSPSVNASPSVFFPVPGNLCLLHDYQLKALHREVFRDRKCPWRKIKYCLGCRKSTEVNSCCSRAHPKPDNFPPYLPSPPLHLLLHFEREGGFTVPCLMAPGLKWPCHHLFVPAKSFKIRLKHQGRQNNFSVSW